MRIVELVGLALILLVISVYVDFIKDLISLIIIKRKNNS